MLESDQLLDESGRIAGNNHDVFFSGLQKIPINHFPCLKGNKQAFIKFNQ